MGIQKTPYHSYKSGTLPRGCQLCVKGSKLVLFVTGLCSAHCYFCPISEKKYNKDVVYADEWPIKNDKELLEEARMIKAEGAGITGGDPLARVERTARYIKLLKKKFGKKFHIHLYTPLNLVDENSLKRLYTSGLDEIRFHPSLEHKKNWLKITMARKYKWKVGVEIPVIPIKEKQIKELIDFIKGRVDFLNMNELEYSDTNASNLYKMGLKTRGGISYAIKGSHELALKLLKYANGKIKNAHYCTTRLKDAVQLANRIKRRAKNAAKDYDFINKEGMLIRGAIYLSSLKPGVGYRRKLEMLAKNKRAKITKKLAVIKNQLKKDFKIKNNLIEIDKNKLRILTSVKAVEGIKDKINEHILNNAGDKKLFKGKELYLAIVEEYPTWDQTEISIEFL